jgi:alpha-L-rhamnosidase
MRKLYPGLSSIILFIFLLIPSGISGQASKEINPRLMEDYWSAYWITHPTASTVDFGVYHFRKDFDLDNTPGKFIVNVSADNRYKLYVNGTEAGFGPARGDLAHWHFETIDIAPLLQPGKNVVAAVVWNYSVHRPWAQFSIRTGFLLQGNSPAEEILNTNDSWKVTKNEAFSPLSDFSHLQTFIVVGPGEQVDANLYPWGWQEAGYDASEWKNASQLMNARPRGIGTDIDWTMTPRMIPMMENRKERFSEVRRSTGNVADASGIIKGNPVTIPANSKVSLLLDHGHLTKGYPVMTVSGGAQSNILITYAEALFEAGDAPGGLTSRKRHRDRVEGMEIKGIYDKFIADGGFDRIFSPLWYRTWRYMQLDIETGDEPLVLNDIYGTYSAYPFNENGYFQTASPLFDDIWEVGWRTARLCAQETYYDCPYYEQLNYVGDTRIQALVSLYVSGDDRLMRKALHLFDISRTHEGITYSRYPSYSPQFIPPYSLVWITMVHDYYMHRDDPEFIKGFYVGIRNIVDWYMKYIDKETGMLGANPYWNFVDWADEWPWDNELRVGGVPSGGMTGNSSILSLQLAYTLNEAASLMDFMDDTHLAEKYRKTAQQINEAVMRNTWSADRELIADTPAKTIFSQHANILGILSGALTPDRSSEVMDKILSDESLIQATMYFRFYLFMAMNQTGHGNKFTDQLHQWEEMLNLGLTTFAEKPEPTRSDCHAWSASPLYFFLSGMAGIMPDEPSFKSVRIEPHPGDLDFFNAGVPHPNGDILFQGTGLQTSTPVFNITLPADTPGRLIWRGQEYHLQPGKNEIVHKPASTSDK